MLAWITGSHKAHARLSGSKLVLSLPDAITPSVWTLDMDACDSTILRMEIDTDGLFHIVWDRGDNDQDILASYHRRGPAVLALMKAARAIGKYQRVSQGAESGKRRINIGKIILLVLLVAFLAWVAHAWFRVSDSNPALDAQLQQLMEQSGRIPDMAPRIDPNSSGVPIPLEDYLQRPAN